MHHQSDIAAAFRESVLRNSKATSSCTQRILCQRFAGAASTFPMWKLTLDRTRADVFRR